MGCCFGKELVAIEGLVRDLLEAVVIVLVKHVAGRFVCSKIGLHHWYVLRVGRSTPVVWAFESRGEYFYLFSLLSDCGKSLMP